MNIEHKSFACKVSAIDEYKGMISGHLSTFGNEDTQKDVVHPGAFKKTVSEAGLRKESQGRKYLMPMLWMHDPSKPIGGYTLLREDKDGLYFEAEFDISTSAQGIPNNPQAVAAFSGARKGYMDEQSIGYETIMRDFGENGIRNIREVRLWEGSLVTMNFAANNQALVSGVKSGDDLEEKGIDELDEKVTICGSTSGPIGARDEAWSGSKAKAQIFKAAEGEDGDLNASICRKYFMVLDGDPSEKGSWKYPFWYCGTSPHICVGAVKAIAGLVQGARGTTAPGGLKSKVATLYRRINAKYPDAPELVPPWKGSDEEYEQKAGRAVSSALAQVISAHADHLRERVNMHRQNVHNTADNLDSLAQADGMPPQHQGALAAHADHLRQHANTHHHTIHNVADALESLYAVDESMDAGGRESSGTNKFTDRRRPDAPPAQPSDDEIAAALSILTSLTKGA